MFNPLALLAVTGRTAAQGVKRLPQTLNPEDADALVKPTPGINPSAKMPPLTGYWSRADMAGLPDASMVNPPLATPSFNPAEALSSPKNVNPGIDTSGVGVPVPPLPGRPGGPRPYDPVTKAQYDYVIEGAKRDADGNLTGGFKRSWKDSLKAALIGAGQGAQASPGNPLAGMLGGALGAGVGTAINPMAGREMVFDATIAPGMLAEQQRAQQAAQFRAALEKEQLDQQYRQAQIGRIEHQNQMEQAEATRRALEAEAKAKREGFTSVAPGATLYNTVTGQPVYTAPGRERQMSMADAEGERAAEEGSVEEIAASSTDARHEEIISKLPPKFRDILTKGYYEADVPAMDAEGNPIAGQMTRQQVTPSDAEMMAAQKAFDQAYDRLLKINLRYTAGVAKRKAARRRTGKQGASGVSSIAPRNVHDMLQWLN
jgi:hypothetical protein